jgi:hypothetical protein
VSGCYPLEVMMDEHEDDLEAPLVEIPGDDAALIADAIATGLDRIAQVIEKGVEQIVAALEESRTGP